MKFKGKSEQSLNELASLGIKYEGDGWVTGYPIIEGETAYILNGVVEVDSEYITIREWVPVFKDSLEPTSPSLTDDQQVVLEWLKEACKRASWVTPFGAIYGVINSYEPFIRAKLSKEEQYQVLAAFAEWGMEREAEW